MVLPSVPAVLLPLFFLIFRYGCILLQFLNTFGFYKVDCGSDNDNIISAGLQGNDGITVIMGTGVCIFRIINGVRTQISGWGYLLDEGGSAFNLGREALSACYSSLDGSGPYTILAESIGVQTDNLGRSFLNRIYAEGKRLIASFAPNVLEAANLGDEVALEAFVQAAVGEESFGTFSPVHLK